MDEVRQALKDDVMLGRLDERTASLKAAVENLLAMHQAGTKEVTAALAAVQAAKEADTKEVLLAIKEHMMEDTKRFGEHDLRIKDIEIWKSNFMGKVAGIILVAGGILGLIAWATNTFY